MILDRIFGFESRAEVQWSGSVLSQDATAKRVWGNAGATSSGVTITEDSAQSIAAVYCAIALLSRTVGHLPLFVYRRINDEGDKEPARNHPLFPLLHRRPNREATAIQCRQLWMAFTLLWGRSYSYIERNNAAEVLGLWPMRTEEVRRRRGSDGKLAYYIENVKDNDLLPRPPTSRNVLDSGDVLEFSTFDGESIISHAREQLGEAAAAQNFAGGFFAGGAQPYAVLTHPGRMKDVERVRKNWEQTHGTARRRIGVLEEGMDIKTIGMPLDDAQFLESRQFHVAEIARWFDIPPHKLKDLSRATFSNIEEQNLEWRESLLPWLEMIEQRLDVSLLQGGEEFYTEHNLDELLRADTEKRYAAHQTSILAGWRNRNEVRRREGDNSMGPDGDIYLIPANTTTIEKMNEPPPAPIVPAAVAGAPPPDGPANAAREGLSAAVRRMAAKEVAEIRAAAKTPERFLDFLEKYRQQWPVKWRAGLSAALDGCRAMGIAVRETEWPCPAVADNLLQLAGRCRPAELPAEVDAYLERTGPSMTAALVRQFLEEPQ